MIKTQIIYQDVWRTKPDSGQNILDEILPSPETIGKNVTRETVSDDGLTAYRYIYHEPKYNSIYTLDITHDKNKGLIQVHGEAHPGAQTTGAKSRDVWDDMFNDLLTKIISMDSVVSIDLIDMDDNGMDILTDIATGAIFPEWPTVVINSLGNGNVLVSSESLHDLLVRQFLSGMQTEQDKEGSIEIHLPDGRIIVADPRRFVSVKALSDTVHDIVLMSNMDRYIPDLSYDAISKRKVQKFTEHVLETKKADEHEHTKDIESALHEIEKLEDALKIKQQQIENLERELNGLKASISGKDNMPVIFLGHEKDMFYGEIKDFILSSINDTLAGTPQGTRKYDVLKDILDSNDYEKVHEARRKKVLDIISSSPNISSSAASQLMKEMGFSVEMGGKHYKCVPYGDERYMVTISATPSDKKTGINVAATINRAVN